MLEIRSINSFNLLGLKVLPCTLNPGKEINRQVFFLPVVTRCGLRA